MGHRAFVASHINLDLSWWHPTMCCCGSENKQWNLTSCPPGKFDCKRLVSNNSTSVVSTWLIIFRWIWSAKFAKVCVLAFEFDKSHSTPDTLRCSWRTTWLPQANDSLSLYIKSALSSKHNHKKPGDPGADHFWKFQCQVYCSCLHKHAPKWFRKTHMCLSEHIDNNASPWKRRVCTERASQWTAYQLLCWLSLREWCGWLHSYLEVWYWHPEA